MAGTKFHIVSCFALFALLVAPFAWQLTRVERVDLPADRIHALSWNASRFAQEQRHVLTIYYVNTEPKHLKSRSTRIEYSASQLQLTVEKTAQLSALVPGGLDDALLDLVPQSGGSFSVIVLCDGATPSASEIIVGKHRHAWAHGCTVDEALLAELAEQHVFPVETAIADRSRARVAVKYRLHFALLKEHGDAAWTWQFEQLRAQYIDPMLTKIASLAHFTVEHQTLHYAKIAKEIHHNAATKSYYVLAEDLKRFKSTNDFLTSSVVADREQVLHFMAALPAEEHAPLGIKSAAASDRLAAAFEIPSWGVVAILDPRQLQARTEERRELQRLMGHFTTELRALLGLPSFHQRARKVRAGLQFLPSAVDGVAQWEVDAVARNLLRRHVRASIETLQSIEKLVVDMPQMSVLERVAQRVTHALELVESILCIGVSTSASSQCESLLDPTNAAELLGRARDAVDEADAAYYDHTMIRQLYFPQEQMLGVFAPLLAPLLLPFVLGWMRELKQLRAKRKAKAAL